MRKERHGPIPYDYQPIKTCFISVRDPVSLYVSLFGFGAAEKMGKLYAKLMHKGYPGLYEPNVRGFERWLDFILDPKKAEIISRNYALFAPYQSIGLLTYRLLSMSVPHATDRLKEMKPTEKAKLKKLLRQERAYNDYVRTEHLTTDLFSMFKRHESELVFNYPLTTAEDLVARVPKINNSAKIEGVSAKTISAELRERIVKREWLFYWQFGYLDNPQGTPSDENDDFDFFDE